MISRMDWGIHQLKGQLDSGGEAFGIYPDQRSHPENLDA